MLELSNVGNMSISKILFKSRDKVLSMTSKTDIMTSIDLFQNSFVLTRPIVAISPDIIKFVTMFIKKFFKGSKKVQRIRNHMSKCNLYLYFLI